jgi:hypothetical protein
MCNKKIFRFENKRFLGFYLFLVETAMILINGSVYKIEKDKSQLVLWGTVPTVLMVLVPVLIMGIRFTVQARTGRGISRETLDHILRANNNNYLQQVSETISLIVGCSIPDQIGTSWLTGPDSDTETYFIPGRGTPVRNKSHKFRLFRCRQWF